MNDGQKEFYAALWIGGIIALVLFFSVAVALTAK